MKQTLRQLFIRFNRPLLIAILFFLTLIFSTLPTEPKEEILGSQKIHIVPSPLSKVTSTSIPTPSPTRTFLPTRYLTATPSPLPPTTRPNVIQSEPTHVPTIIPSLTESPPLSVTPTIQTQHVTLEITLPDQTISTPIDIQQQMNVCDILTKAKDTGKINSLTFDDSYLAVYKSLYVQEINGYKNNWTFIVNDSSPLGCSLYTVKPGDIIKWKFN